GLTAGNSALFKSPLTSFILMSLVIEMTPGPNMPYLAVLGASRGRIAGFRNHVRHVSGVVGGHRNGKGQAASPQKLPATNSAGQDPIRTSVALTSNPPVCKARLLIAAREYGQIFCSTA